MKRTLPAPKVRVTSSGSRPNSLEASLWTQRTSLPALARSTGAYHWKPGSPSQTSALSSWVSASLVSRLRRPSSVSSKWLGDPRAPAAGLGRVEHDRAEVAQLGVEQRELAPLPARHEDQAARLVLDQPLQQPALLGRQLAVFHADVAQEDHVELGELVEAGGKLLDVVLVAAARLAQPRMEQQARELDARVAREGVAQVAVFPARIRLDDQHAQLLLADRDRGRQLVVVGQRFVGVLGNVSVSVKSPVAFGFQTSQSLVRLIGGDAHFLRDLVAVGRAERDGRRRTRAAASCRS